MRFIEEKVKSLLNSGMKGKKGRKGRQRIVMENTWISLIFIPGKKYQSKIKLKKKRRAKSDSRPRPIRSKFPFHIHTFMDSSRCCSRRRNSLSFLPNRNESEQTNNVIISIDNATIYNSNEGHWEPRVNRVGRMLDSNPISNQS